MWISRRNLLKGLSVAALGSIFPTPMIETLPGCPMPQRSRFQYYPKDLAEGVGWP